MKPMDWIISGDTGASSKTIFAVMVGSKTVRPDVPHDPSDFGRCYRLLALFPEWRSRLHEVAEKYPMWGPLIGAWDELSALYEYEAAMKTGRELFDRMQVLIDEGRVAAGWTKTGPGCWRGPTFSVIDLGCASVKIDDGAGANEKDGI